MAVVSKIGFANSYSIVRRVVREMKFHYIPAQADMPWEYAYGDAIEIDWDEATISRAVSEEFQAQKKKMKRILLLL